MQDLQATGSALATELVRPFQEIVAMNGKIQRGEATYGESKASGRNLAQALEVASLVVGGTAVAAKLGSKARNFVDKLGSAGKANLEETLQLSRVEVAALRQRVHNVAEKGRAAGTGQASRWLDASGNIIWPKNNGFARNPQSVTLQTGTRIDKYELENGKFVSPEGTPYNQRSLAPGTESKPYTVYEVVKPIEAQDGKIAPWFDEPGGGIQFKFDKSIKELIDGGYLRRVER